MCHNLWGIVKKIQETYLAECAKTLEEVDRHEGIVEANAQVLDGKLHDLIEKKDGVIQATDNLRNLNATLTKFREESMRVSQMADGPLAYMKANNVYQEMWLERNWKCAAIDACILQLKKAFSDRLIDLHTFLEYTRKLSAKQFKCIYAKSSLEMKYKAASAAL